MTETQTVEPTDEATELKPLAEVYGPAGEQIVAQANQLIQKSNTAAQWLRDNSRDPQEVVDAFKSGETKDKDISPLLTKRESLAVELEKLDAEVFVLAEKKAKAQLEKETNTADVEKHETAYREHAKAVRETEKAMTTIFNDEILAYLDNQVTLKRRSSSAGTGKGPKRYRGFEVRVNGHLAQKKMGKSQELKSSFGAAADHIGNVTLETVTKGYTDAVGTTDADKFPVDKTVTYEVTDTEGKTYKIEATKVS